MQVPSENKKRLIWIFLPLVLLAGILALLVASEQARSYKKVTMGETTLYVPKSYMVEAKADMAAMLRDFVGSIEHPKYQFVGYADQILPNALTVNEDVAGSSIIWTIEATDTNAGARVTAADKALFQGTAPYEARRTSVDTQSGLFKLKKNEADSRSYAFTNQDPSANAGSDDLWVAHCIELGTIRRGGPWRRCTRQLIINQLLVQIHYDGRLLVDTEQVTNGIQNKLNAWRHHP